MPVSLYDMMRPIAIGSGLGVGCAGESGASLVVGGLVGLAAGTIAFVVAGRLAKAWFARHPAGSPASAEHTRDRSSASEAAHGAAYVAIFAVLLAVTWLGTLFGRWLVTAVWS